jgi:hypothetical protein
MSQALIDFGTGAILGGLALSACWGLLWLVVSSVGYSRGTCGGCAVFNSVVAGGFPIVLAWVLLWIRAEAFSPNIAFAAGLSIMPLVLTGLSLRQVSDGRRAGVHMLEQGRRLMDELLGSHHACGGCGHDHDPDSSGGRA